MSLSSTSPRAEVTPRMSLTDLCATNICEFTSITTVTNRDNGLCTGVRFKKPDLIDRPSAWKRETDRPAWAEDMAYRRTQKMLIQRDFLSGGLAIDAPDMKKAKTQLKEMARLAERGVSPEQISWKVGFEKNFAARGPTEKQLALKGRMDLTRKAQANLMLLIAELQGEGKYTGPTKDICELLKKGLTATLAEQTPFVPGTPQRKRADVASVAPQGQLVLAGQPQPASTGRPQPQQAQEDPQVTAQKLFKKKMLGDAAVTVAAYQRDPRSVPAADYNLAKALLQQDQADRELAEFMKNQQTSATASTPGSRPTQTTTNPRSTTTTTAATGATRTTTTTATTATTTTTSTTVPTNAQRGNPAQAQPTPRRNSGIEEVQDIPPNAKVVNTQPIVEDPSVVKPRLNPRVWEQ